MRTVLLLFILIAPLYARLGENRAELTARLGSVRSESKHFVTAQGQIVPLGPALFFNKDQWHIQCDLVKERCAKITYSKKGEWTAEQISTLMQNNAQKQQWIEDKNSNEMIRQWTRSDGGKAKWLFTGSLEILSPEYIRAKAEWELALTTKAQEKPNL